MQNNQQNNKENNQNIQNIQTNNGQRIVVNFVPGTGRRILQPTNQAPHQNPQHAYQWTQFQQPPFRVQIPAQIPQQHVQPLRQGIQAAPFRVQIPQQQPLRQGIQTVQVQQHVSSDFKRQKIMVSTASNVIKMVQVVKQPQNPVIIVSVLNMK